MGSLLGSLLGAFCFHQKDSIEGESIETRDEQELDRNGSKGVDEYQVNMNEERRRIHVMGISSRPSLNQSQKNRNNVRTNEHTRNMPLVFPRSFVDDE